MTHVRANRYFEPYVISGLTPNAPDVETKPGQPHARQGSAEGQQVSMCSYITSLAKR